MSTSKLNQPKITSFHSLILNFVRSEEQLKYVELHYLCTNLRFIGKFLFWTSSKWAHIIRLQLKQIQIVLFDSICIFTCSLIWSRIVRVLTQCFFYLRYNGSNAMWVILVRLNPKMQKIHLHKLNFTAVAQSHLHLFHLCKWSKDITKFVFDIDSFLFLKQQMKLDGSNGFISFIINYAVSICGFFVGSPSVKSWSTKYRFKFIAFSCRFNYFFKKL